MNNKEKAKQLKEIIKYKKLELKNLKRITRDRERQVKANNKKINYLDYKMGVIVTEESKQILFIGKTLKAIHFYIDCKIVQFINKYNPEGIKENLIMLKGLKSTSEYLGISEEKIINGYLELKKKDA